MPTYRDNAKEFMDRVERVDITDYVQTFLIGFRKKHGNILKMNSVGEAGYLKQLLNSPQGKVCSPFENLNGFFYWNTQKVDFVPSNLGGSKGFLFYFICSYCGSRAKYLYRHRTYDEPSCRACCKLGYVPQSRRQTRYLSRLIRKPYLSGEAKWALIKYAGITKEDLPQEV